MSRFFFPSLSLLSLVHSVSLRETGKPGSKREKRTKKTSDFTISQRQAYKPSAEKVFRLNRSFKAHRAYFLYPASTEGSRRQKKSKRGKRSETERRNRSVVPLCLGYGQKPCPPFNVEIKMRPEYMRERVLTQDLTFLQVIRARIQQCVSFVIFV